MQSIGIAGEDLAWSQKWSYWFRRQVSVLSPASQWYSEQALKAFDSAGDLRKFQRVAPKQLPASQGVFDKRFVHSLAREAEIHLSKAPSLHNGKWNAPFGDAIYELIDECDLVRVIGEQTGAKVSEPHGGTYIAYLNEGEHLDFHLDHYDFGDINLLLCITHISNDVDQILSSTVTLGADGLTQYCLESGDALIFDGSFTPHGRTPIKSGEKVILASLAFNIDPASPWDESALPDPDAVLKGEA